jgi:streptogramin lyase
LPLKNSVLLLPVLSLLAGCAIAPNSTPTTAETGQALQGSVYGGQQPVDQAHVYLFAAGTSGYGGSSASLITSGSAGSDALGAYVTTNARGFFTITGDYNCTSGSLIYLLATQGNPGLGAGQSNPNLALMTVLGPCPSSGNFLSTFPFISINEVTTVAGVYALSGFMTDLTHVSSNNTTQSLQGIASAFAAATNLASSVNGLALTTTPAGNGTVPQAEINTLADILASCVNSNGAGSDNCTTLFANATNAGVQPTDTVTAALNIAHNPGLNVANLYGLQTATPPFAPNLTTAPNDFTIALKFTGGGLFEPGGVAIDASGNVWVANYSSAQGFVTELGPTGTILGPSSGYPVGVNPNGIAIDTSGFVWVANDGSHSVSKLNGTTGAPVTGSPFSVGTQNPFGLSIDQQGNIWVAGNGIVKLNGSTGASILTNPTSAGYIAVDPSNTTWSTEFVGESSTITRLTTTGSAYPGSPYTAAGGDGPIAFDSAGNAWIAGVNGVTEISSAGATVSGSPFTGGGECGGCTNGIAIDGLGNVWLSDGEFEPPFRIGLTEFNNAGAPVSSSTGYQTSYLTYPLALAIDPSGNVWLTDNGGPDIIEFVGAAVPVVTPIAAGVANNTLGTRP